MTEPEYASKQSVAGLAREVEALRKAWRPASAQLAELARVVGELTEVAATAGSPAQKVVAPSWLDMPADPDQVAELLSNLCKWMTGVFLRYPDAVTALPDCWLWHPDVVEELVWLMHTWTAAYTDDNASAQAAGDWHDRYRPGVVKRIASSAGTCSLENHSDPLPAAAVPLAAEAAEVITTWWADARRDQAPVPDEVHLAAAEPETTRRRARR